VNPFPSTSQHGPRIGALLACLAAVAAAPAAAQDCGRDCADIAAQALLAFAEHVDVPPDRVFVDTMASGRTFPGAPPAVAPLPLSAGDIVPASRRLGFRVLTTPEYDECFVVSSPTMPAFCDGAGALAGVLLFAPEVRGDSATIHLRHHVDRPDRSIVNAGVLRVELVREDGGWQVTGLDVLARGHRRR
jgi:hypothetical protein